MEELPLEEWIVNQISRRELTKTLIPLVWIHQLLWMLIMNDTQTNSLFTELTTEESATINGAHYYYYPRRYAWWRNRRRPIAYRPYNNNSTTVNVKVKVNVDS
ncbi:MAG TPA: hypothetical protein DCE56_41405 [Cyanobacteria bacterium UBA8553]|nr:hypothetical protein [Cyanobacteria bacterium UBA8553]HAJ64674.1 hypothetical protein [Cyanobacteria bacterium UBA8543]